MMERTLYDDVFDFHRKWHEPPLTPRIVDGDVWATRVRLITEEFAETAKAHAFKDIAAFADGLVDLTWVVMGTSVMAGLPYNKIWNEVTRANMDKFRDGAHLDVTGKILKPKGWIPPDVTGIILETMEERL